MRSRPGNPPGHPIITATADGRATPVSWTRYHPSLFEEDAATTLEEAIEGFDPAAVDWLHIATEPDATTLRWLHERLGLDTLALEDVHNGHQRTKFEHCEGHSFMAISVPVQRDSELVLEHESLEEELLSSPGESVVQDIHALRRKLALMRRLVLPGQSALERLLHDDDSPLSTTTRHYIRDVLDHQLRIGEHIDSLGEVTRGLHELHLMGTSHRMNEVMRLLTIIATIFIPLTFIAGIYGMNFDPDVSTWNMPELRMRFGYPAVMLLFAAIGGGMVWMFRRRGWF